MVHIKHKIRGATKIEIRGEPRYRSRRGIRRTQRKTPGNRTVVHYKKKAPGKALCAICKNYLHGLPRGLPVKIRRLSKTDRTVQRPFGANLCSPCTREILIWRARVKHKLARPDEVPISLREFILPGAK
ncbi:MAG: hypothetical protein QW063_01000 [Candidatus Nanoarchaeia archaeon]